MKNRMKKLAALMLVGVALCGGVMTTQAAVSRTCGHSEVKDTVSSSPVSYDHQVYVNGQVKTCHVTAQKVTVVVNCVQCGVELHRSTTQVSENHSVSH